MLVPDLNPEPSALTPDLVPLGPHGYVQEVNAATGLGLGLAINPTPTPYPYPYGYPYPYPYLYP